MCGTNFTHNSSGTKIPLYTEYGRTANLMAAQVPRTTRPTSNWSTPATLQAGSSVSLRSKQNTVGRLFRRNPHTQNSVANFYRQDHPDKTADLRTGHEFHVIISPQSWSAQSLSSLKLIRFTAVSSSRLEIIGRPRYKRNCGWGTIKGSGHPVCL